MMMIDTMTMFGIDQREYEQTVADYAYAMGCDVAVRMARERGIEPRYRPDVIMMAKADEAHRKAHEAACAMAAGTKVARRARGQNKLTLASALKQAASAGQQVSSATIADGKIEIKFGKPETAESDDAWNKALGL
jgi:hypothetical protein